MSRGWRKYLRRGATGVGMGGVGIVAYSIFNMLELKKVAETSYRVKAEGVKAQPAKRLEKFPSRTAQIQSLKEREFDVLVIGGGATGTGVALEAQARGLNAALVEKNDFSSGTSSRSTKLIHGGVRYLQKAIMGFDKEQYHMVSEALQERANLVEIAPHLAYALPIMLPVYAWWQIPYYWVGIKAYDVVAGRQLLKSSYFIGKEKSLEKFPMLKKDSLKGAIVYYDGQHNDARMCLSIGLTAARFGTTLANHVEVVSLTKSPVEDCPGKCQISGAKCRDRLTGEEFTVKAKSVVNATGPFTDSIRQMDNPSEKAICQPSAGVHVVLPDYYSPEEMGLLDPNTSDGRVIFFLPWMKYTVAGTTDSPCPVTEEPQPTEQDVEFILGEIKKYLNADITVRRGDVTSCWSGIRPLVTDPKKTDTQSLARNHIIHVSKDGLVTIAGGKWTTYRSMASETIDALLEAHKGVKPSRPEASTLGLMLEGAEKWSPTLYIRLVQDFGMETAVAQHLASTYGDKAVNVAKLSGLTGKRWPVHGVRLHEEFPYLEGEVRYACKAEYAQTAEDILARRTRLAFLNANAAKEALPRILQIMQEELGWSDSRRQDEEKIADHFLSVQMGIELRRKADKVAIRYTAEEINKLSDKFRIIDADNKGFISAKDLQRVVKAAGYQLSEDQMHGLLDEVDTNRNGKIELGEFLQFMSAVDAGVVTNNAFLAAAGLDVKTQSFGPERSGGGV